MPERPFWRHIKLRHVNVALYVVIGCLLVLFWRELRWAADQFPGYLDGTFSDPPERELFQEAQAILDEGDEERAQALFRESLAIDPLGESAYWVARHHLEAGRDAQALKGFVEYLEVDPTNFRTYLKIAEIHGRNGRPLDERAILERGVRFFEAGAARHVPRPDPAVGEVYHRKALETQRRFVTGSEQLRFELTLREAP